MGRKLLISHGVVDLYTFLIDTWNTLPESYQQKVYKITLATFKRQIQQAQNAMPALVISMEAAHVDNAIRLDHLTTEVALEEPKIGSTDRHITMYNNCTDDKLHLGMPRGSRDYEDVGDESNDIPTASRRWRATTELQWFHLVTSDVDKYEGEDGDDADADEQEEALQADDVSLQNVEDWGQSWFDLGTSDVDLYDGEDGADADADEEDEASQADDASTQNVEHWGHTSAKCKSVRKPHAILPDTPGDLTSSSKYF